ncbi:MAG: DUF4293 domain-containing protein [Muribaculaceae bacterium]|nr:DUF4293 domain-containing protein [Muribaculaceae bacterium]
MVLQRWQSVFLFLAAIAMAVFTFMPVMGLIADDGNISLSALGCGENGVCSYLLLTLDCLIVVMLLVTIFKYRDLKLQQRLCKVNILLTVALIMTIAVMWLMQRGQAIAVLTPWVALPFVALFFTMWASGRIKADRKLLSDSERIR